MAEFMLQDTTATELVDLAKEISKTTEKIKGADVVSKIREGMAKYIDTSEMTDWSRFFQDNTRLNLREVAGTMSKGQNFSYCFYNCTEMIDGGTVDMSNASGSFRSATYMFANCTSMTDLTIIANKLSSWVMQRMFYYSSPTLPLTNLTINGTIKVKSSDLNFAYCPYLSRDSILSVLNALQDNTNETTRWTVYLGANNLNKLTDEEKAIAENKNITLQ